MSRIGGGAQKHRQFNHPHGVLPMRDEPVSFKKKSFRSQWMQTRMFAATDARNSECLCRRAQGKQRGDVQKGR